MQEKLKPFKDILGLKFTPGGIYSWDEDKQVKVAIDTKRYDNLNWSNYPKDNIGRVKLPEGIIVLDIDESRTIIEDNHIDLLALNLQLPLGFYANSARPSAYHIYYTVTPQQQAEMGGKFIKSLHGHKIDILQNSIVFEGHPSPNSKVYAGPVLPIPEALYNSIVQHQLDKGHKTNYQAGEKMVLHSNIQRYNLVTRYLQESPMKTTAKNMLIKSITPKEYQTIYKGKQKLKWEQNDLSHDLINKMLVKLATTRELDFYEHLLPTLSKLLDDGWGVDVSSRKSQQYLQSMLVGLPQHTSQLPYQIDDNDKSFHQLMDDQPDTDYPIFRTIHMGKKRFIRISKFLMKPVAYNGEFLLEQAAAQILNTERQQFSEDGKPTVWDEHALPIVEFTEDPYAEGFSVDAHSRHCVNLIERSQFIDDAAPVKLSGHNILMRCMESTIHPDYLELMLYYHAHIVFSSSSPIMIPWAASTELSEGGTGKSMITITILSKILQKLAAQVDLKKLSSGYDMTSGVKLLTLEDSETEVGPQWNAAYAVMKQLQSAAYTKVNPKYGKDKLKKIKVSITGSSNDVPRLSPSDRRVLCIEPAHLHGETEPLTKKEQLDVAMFERADGSEYDSVIQDYTNHLKYLFDIGTPDHITRQLYFKVEHTHYRKNWVLSSVSNTKGITLTLPVAEELISIVIADRIDTNFFYLIRHMLEMYSADQEKMALSWMWFYKLIHYIAADPDIEASKKSVIKMLGNPQFATGSLWAQQLQSVSTMGKDFPLAMHTFKISEQEVNNYKEYLLQHTLKEGETNL